MYRVAARTTPSSQAKEIGIECKPSVVHSSDVFYRDASQGTWQDIIKQNGSDCVEMESFALFHNANMTGKRAACLLTISDSFVDHTELSAEDRQNSFTKMMTLALESAILIYSVLVRIIEMRRPGRVCAFLIHFRCILVTRDVAVSGVRGSYLYYICRNCLL